MVLCFSWVGVSCSPRSLIRFGQPLCFFLFSLPLHVCVCDKWRLRCEVCENWGGGGCEGPCVMIFLLFLLPPTVDVAATLTLLWGFPDTRGSTMRFPRLSLSGDGGESGGPSPSHWYLPLPGMTACVGGGDRERRMRREPAPLSHGLFLLLVHRLPLRNRVRPCRPGGLPTPLPTRGHPGGRRGGRGVVGKRKEEERVERVSLILSYAHCLTLSRSPPPGLPRPLCE